jgi:putative inorganic carbon (HCO3(-)) transporter
MYLVFKLAKDKKENYLRFGLLVTVAFIPLVMSKFSASAFDLIKFSFLLVFTGLLGLSWLLFSEGNLVIQRTKLDLAVFLFFTALLVTTIFSAEPLTSFIGRYGRYEGFLSYLAYFMLFFLSAQLIKERSIQNLPPLFTFLSLPITIYGILQYYQVDFGDWATWGLDLGRSFSTLGNPIFLGSFLVLIWPSMLGFFILTRGWLRWISFSSLALSSWVIITTFSRGAWLGWLVSLLLIFLFSWRWLPQRKLFILVFSFLLLVSATAATTSMFRGKESQNVIKRINTTFQLHTGTSRTRIEIWKAALKVIAERPLLGTGLENFILFYPKYQSLSYVKLAGYRAVADNAHNYFLQLAATGGLLLLLFFLSFLLAFFSLALKVLRNLSLENRLIFTLLLVGLLGYLVSLFFGPSSVGTNTIFWVSIGALSSTLTKSTKVYFKLGQGFRIFMLAAAFTVFLLFYMSARLNLADYYYFHGLAAEGERNLPSAINYFSQAVSLAPVTSKYRIRLGMTYLASSLSSKDRVLAYQDIVQSINILKEAKKRSPQLVDPEMYLAYAYLTAGERFDSRYLNLALTELEAAAKLKRNSVFIPYYLGKIYFLKGDYESAILQLTKAKRVGEKFAYTYWILAQVYEKQGRAKLARQNYYKAWQLDPKLYSARKAYERLSTKF